MNEKGFKLYGYNNLIKVPPRFQRLKKIKEAQGNLDGFDYCYVPKFYKNSVINEVLRLEAFVRNIPEISLSMKDYEPDANLNFLDELAFTPDIFSRNISEKIAHFKHVLQFTINEGTLDCHLSVLQYR